MQTQITHRCVIEEAVNIHGDIKYSFEISLIGLVIQSVGPNHFSKELLKYIYL